MFLFLNHQWCKYFLANYEQLVSEIFFHIISKNITLGIGWYIIKNIYYFIKKNYLPYWQFFSSNQRQKLYFMQRIICVFLTPRLFYYAKGYLKFSWLRLNYKSSRNNENFHEFSYFLRQISVYWLLITSIFLEGEICALWQQNFPAEQ